MGYNSGKRRWIDWLGRILVWMASWRIRRITAKSGFRLSHRNVRYQGKFQQAVRHASIVSANEAGFQQIRDYDRQIFPEPRDVFLQKWLTQPESGAFATVHDGRVSGYTVVRKCRSGWKIGPLAADDLETARHLLKAAGSHATLGEAVYLDVPETNSAAKELIAEFGMTPVFETARMYKGPNPRIDETKLFGDDV